MEHKSNSYKVNRHQREKVLRFSIRKYSFGAASVAVAALLFLSGHQAVRVEAAQVSDTTEAPVIPDKEEAHTATIVDLPKTEDSLTTGKEEKSLTTAENPAETLSEKLPETSTENASENETTALDKEVVEKQTLDKTKLQANITKVQELLDKVNKEKAPASTLAAIQADLETANSVLNNNSLELTQAEIDAATKKLKEQIFILRSMPKIGAPEKVVKEGENTIANTGSRDSRNGQSMGEGTQFRAYTATSSSGALKNVRYFASVDSRSNGGSNTRNDDPEFTEKKTVIKSRYEQNSSGKWMVYDVYFNNNGVAMADRSYSQHYYFQPPFNIMDDSNKVENLTFTRYQNLDGNPNRKLSDGGSGFQKVGETATISDPWQQKTNVFPEDRRSTYDPQGVSRANQKWQVFKHNQNDPYLDKIVKRTDGSYTGNISYTLGLEVGWRNLDYAIHMTARVKLKNNVTETEAANGNVYAASVTTGETTNQSYVVGSQGTSLQAKPDASLYPIEGSTHTKVVGDAIPNSGNPVADKYITRKGSGDFPAGMSWSWKNNSAPSTAEAGKFTYTAIARYQDNSTSEDANSGSDGKVYFTVNPKKPVITASDVQNKKGLTNQQITVNVGRGVKNGSTVTLYDGNNVIGTGTTNGTTATITVAGALTGNQITAETKVDNGGVVVSEKSDPVRPTEAPDNQAPTVKMTNPTDNNKVSVLTSNDTNTPTTRIYRGATLNVPLKMYDNDPRGKVNLKYEGGLPKGGTLENGPTLSKIGAVETKPETAKVIGKVATDAKLGKQTVTFKVSDDQGGNVDRGNNATVKFNVEVVDLDFQKNKGEVKPDGTLVVKTSKGASYSDSHDFITATDGKDVSDRFFPGDMKFRFIQPNNTVSKVVTFNDPGKQTVKAAAYFHNGYAGTNGIDKVTNSTPGKDNEILNRSFLYKTIEFQVKPTAPTVTPENNGDVTVTPVSENNVNTFNFTYNEPNNSSRKITATKTENGWTLSNAPADGVTIDKTTGKVTIKDRAIKDSVPVTAKSETNDHVESDPSTVNSKVGENEPPVFTFKPNGKEARVEANKEQVVYVTPTEETRLTIGTVTDNSNKLVEARLKEKNGNTANGLGFPGLTYNDAPKENNKEFGAPREITLTGKVNKYSNGTTPWRDNVEYSRFARATDASGNELNNQSDGVNPTRIKLRILTQATKYDPQIPPQAINKDVTESDAKVTQEEFDAIKSNITFTSQRGEVKISNGANNRTVDLNITMNDNGKIKKNATNGSYYVSATITYPDLSTENIEIPVSKSDTTAPKVTINGKELSETATDYSFVVFKGSTFNPTLRVSDDKNNVKSVSVSGLPSGNNFSATGDWSKNGANVQVVGDTITATNNATLGDHEASIVVKDALNNEKTYKFKYKVVDVAIRETPKTVSLNTQLGDSHNYVKVVDGTSADGDEKYYPDGMRFKWKKGTVEVAGNTRLTRPGIVTEYKPLVEFKSGAGYYTKTIDGNQVKVYTPATIEREQTFHVKPTAPTITPLEKGDVTVTPVSEENVNTLDFEYIHPNDKTIQITATKTGNKWSLSPNTPADGVTINPNTGVVTIKDRAIKDKTAITAKSVTADRVESDPTTENSKVGDTEPPKFEFTPNGVETKVESNGEQVVYVTPTEDTNLTIGKVTDDSNKLTEVRIALGQTFNIGLGEGLSYNEAVRKSNVELDAPRDVTISGNLGDYKTGTTKWTDNDEVTRYVVAKDAATNELNNQTNDVTNKSRIKFKVLTQATKYEPQITTQPINVDVTATNAKITPEDFASMKSNLTFTSTRGTVKVDNTTSGLTITMKEDGAIKPKDNGTYYVGATITYPDHSTEDIEIPVTKADANVPSATMDGMLLTNDENTTANFVVFKGAKFNPTFNVRDDKNKITNLKVTGLPNGTEIEKTGTWNSGTNVKITEAANTSTSTADLGERVGEVTITDSLGNTGTYKYKYKVVDVEVRNSPETVELGTKLVDAANLNNGKDSHNYVKLVDGLNSDGTKKDADDKYYPAGMHFKWSKNHTEVTDTTEFNKPGVVTDYKALVKFPSGAGYYTTNIDGKAVKVYTPASVEKDVTFHVAPPKPTFNQDAVSSTTRKISGTLGGFTLDNNNDRVVEVHLNDKDNTVLSSKNGQVTIDGDTWTATLPDGKNLRQSENKNGETEKPLPITVVNKVGETTVSKTSEPKVVKMGNYSPSATIAGSKHIDVTVPHDAKRLELRFHNSADTDNKPNSIVLVRDENGGNWQVDPSTAPAGVTNANNFVQGITNSINEANKAENKVSITLKETDNNKKLLIKEETASGDNTDNYTSGLGLRVDYKPEAGQNATPAGNWQVISVSNDAPVVTLKDAAVGTQENPKVYTAGTALTADLLKELVTVSDTEDDRTTDKPFGTGTVNVSGLPENPTAGVYTVTLQPVDSQGKAGNQVTVHVVVKEEKPAAPTISQWQNGNIKVMPSTNNGGDKVTIPLADGTVTLVKKDSGWELETPKEGVVFRNGSVEIPKKLVGTSVTAKATKGTGDSSVDSDDATYTPKPHKVTTVDVIKEVDSPLTNSDLSGKTGVTGVVDGTETKDFTAAKITSVVEKSPLPNVTSDSKHTIPVTITYEDGSTETTDVIVKVKPQAPTVTPKENGTVEITPILTGEGTTTITYTGEDNTPQTVTVTKGENGTWTSPDPTIAVDANGKVTIPADKVKDGSPVTAKVTSKTTDLTSQSSTETAGKPLTVEVGTPVDAIENKAYTSDKVVTPNKDNSTITPTPKNGLTVTPDGKVTGTPDVKDWGEIEENRTVTIKVTVTHEGDTPVEKDVVVNVLRDTDGDGIPDKDDSDDDNDGIPDDQDKNPKVADELKGNVIPPAPVREKAQVPPVTVVTTNKPGATITTENPPVNGLSVNGNGELTGTPTVDTWGKDEEERQINIPVKVTKEKDGKNGKETEEIKVDVPVTILRDTDGDGTPDKEDTDDDNDGIPDEEEKKNGTDPKAPTTQTPTIGITRKENGDAIVTPTKPGGGTYPPGTKVVIPGDNNTTIEVEIGNDGSGTVPNDKLPKTDKPGTGIVTEPNKEPSKPAEVITPARKTPIVELEQNPKTGDVTVTPKKPGGEIYPPGTIVEIPGKDGNPIRVEIGQNGKGTVPNSELPDGNTPGTAKITEPNKPVDEVKVETPARKTPTVELQQDPDTGEVTVTPKKPDGSKYSPGTKVEIPGKNGTPIVVTIGEDGKGKVPNKDLPDGNISGSGTITEPGTGKTPEKVTVETPARLTPALVLDQDPNTGDVTVTPKKPDGTTYPPGTKVEIPGKNGVPIEVTTGPDGKVIIPNKDLPDGEIPGTGKITPPGKPSIELEVKTPKKLDPNAPQTEKPEKPGGIEITRKPNGDAVVTPKRKDETKYPPGTKVVIPGDNNTPIEVIIGEDGSGTVPNDKLPKRDLPGKGIVTEPNKRPSQPVDVTTPARKTPTLDVERDPKTGDVTVTPKKPDGSTYPPGTTVEIPGENGPITVEIGQDGKGKVPNDKLPKTDKPGTGKITAPGQPTEEVPNVTTPGKFTPATPVTEKPGKIEITQQPNGNAIVTPKKPDGSTYPPGTTVEIPGENGTTITVTIGDNGSGEVPNDNLPKTDIPGTGRVTELNKKPSQPVDVTTPARKTPTLDVEQDPKTGDVTVTPKKPDGSTYPPGTKVEIPGKDGNPITVTIGEDGKGKVPNSELPEGKVPGTGKITAPGQPTVEVPDVTTPGKVTPSTPTDTNPVAPVTPGMPVKPDTNGDSGQDTPTPAPTTPIPDAVTPNANHEDTTDASDSDNGAKSNDSQNVLPNTGTESNATLASLGLLGMLGGLGLALRKKKED